MKRNLAAAAAALGLLVSAGQAAAAPGDSALQLAGQAAGSGQAAGAQSGATQSQPSNRNISVRVLSPGDNGSVTQSNTVSSNATAANANATGQSADQTQGGSCGCAGGTQATGQEADSSQAATALSYATQSGASNTNIPVRVLSPGDNGNVSQSNSVDSDATAANANLTGQSAEQNAAGGGGTQAVGQEAKSEQDAAAASAAEQKGAENTNISVRVLSKGDDGNVRQSNSVDSSAKAANANLTGQEADQTGGSGTQAIGQEAKSDQSAAAASVAKQEGATNQNIPVRVLSRGDNGSVSQSNSVDSDAKAVNLNALKQDADQDQGGKRTCGCSSDGTQAIGQEAKSDQSAGAFSAAFQSGASNENTPVRVGSKGDDGYVSQSNSVDSDATALNINLTKQDADQDQRGGDCRCGSNGTQAIGQEAKNDQSAAAASLAAQSGGRDRCGCGSSGNTNTPVRVDSKGDGGSVRQSNSVDSDATAANLNALKQDADQDGGSGTQAIGQEAKNEQAAIALSGAFQHGASNSNTPVRVDSKGDDGDVTQRNSVDSDATALNLNATKQDADQDQGGKHTCGCSSDGTQAIGQEAKSEQGALAASLAAQAGASNENTPVGVDSKGDGGSVRQSNSVDSDATAANLNALKQDADQDGGSGTQAIGQEAKNEQAAIALSGAFQHGASNSNTPVRVDSKGDGGRVSQSNSVDSDATALNANLTKQDADQDQGGRSKECGCQDGSGIQAIGQEAKNEQGAFAASLAAQSGGRDRCGCDSSGNTNAPVRVDSYGDGGSVEQSNSVDSDATAANLNALKQDADQDQSGSGGIQAIGQEAKNEQAAIGLSAALQDGASNSNTPVRVDSKGDGGRVSQSNSVDSDATALNANLTKQDADQDQGGRSKECGCQDGIGIQAIGQEAKSEQGALAASLAAQAGASNENAPVRVDSKGDGGSVHQSNSVDSDATAANLNALKQDADQDQAGGGGIAIQAIGQEAKNEQAAIGLSAALQFGASNSNTPVAVDSKGDGGRVSQSNTVESDATALNLNLTKQDADQDQGGRSCGCHDGIGIQAIGQEAKNEQGAFAGSLAIQAFGHDKCGCRSGGNSNTPVGVGSYGSGGSVHQSNSVDSSATALNLNALFQDADQDQSGGGGTQAVGQSAKNSQFALGLSAALQLAARNATGRSRAE